MTNEDDNTGYESMSDEQLRDMLKEAISGDYDVSPCGVEKFDQMLEMMYHYLRLNSIAISDAGGMKGLLCIMVRDVLEKKVEMGLFQVNDDAEEEALFGELERKTDELAYDAIFTIGEAWVTTNSNLHPQKDPKRQSAIVSTLHCNIGFRPRRFTVFQRIVKDGGTVKLSTPEFHLGQCHKLDGIFAGFERNLCPVV
jgi:hypothetical protein